MSEVSVVLVGNKKDLLEEREVPTENGKAIAEENGFYFMETSAKENQDCMIEKVFFTLSRQIVKIQESLGKLDISDDETEYKLGALKKKKELEVKKSSDCCSL